MQFTVENILNLEWLPFFIFLGLITSCVVLTEWTGHFLKWKNETIRKIVHVSIGIMVCFTPFIFASPTLPALLAIIFIMFNAILLKTNIFKLMNLPDRISFGTVYFPLSYLILILIAWHRPVTLILGMCLMTFADTAASLVGEKFNKGHFYTLWKDQKTIPGSLAMFTTSVLIVFMITAYYSWTRNMPVSNFTFIVAISLFTGIIATLSEAASFRGSDNFSVPLFSAIFYDLFYVNHANGVLFEFMVWIFISAIILWTAYKLKSLTKDGLIAAYLMGIFIYGTNGFLWVAPLLGFFILSSILSHVGKFDESAPKRSFGDKSPLFQNIYPQPKGWGKYLFIRVIRKFTYPVIYGGGLGNNNPGGVLTPFRSGLFDGKNKLAITRRDAIQVLSNGSAATVIALFIFYFPEHYEFGYILFLASIAAAASDTWATEIGVFSHIQPRNIISLHKVKKGSSGGVTWLGLAGAAIGSLFIGIIGLISGISFEYFILVCLAGFSGNLIDSILGATVQARFRLENSDTLVESRFIDGKPTVHVKGWAWIDNHMVNLLNTLSSPIIIFCYLYFK